MQPLPMKFQLAVATALIVALSQAEAATHPKIGPDAVQPYTQKAYPKFYAQWGQAGMKRVNELLPRAAEKAASSPECDRVELVELSGQRSVPGKSIVFFVDCKNGKRFYLDEVALKSDAAVASKQAATAGLTSGEADRRCEAALKAQLSNPLTYKRTSGNFYRAPTGNVVVEVVFEAKNDLGAALPSKGRCVFTDRGLEEAVISKS